jgi:hypothetical protein
VKCHTFGHEISLDGIVRGARRRAHAAELAAFAPAQSTAGGRVMVARALETIAIFADLKERALPVIAQLIRERK